MKEISSINKHAAPALLISAFVFGHSGIIEGSEQSGNVSVSLCDSVQYVLCVAQWVCVNLGVV